MRESWLRTLALLGAVLACAACTWTHGENFVTGSGKEITDERKIPEAFTGVETAWASECVVQGGKPQRVAIIGDDNVVPKVKTDTYGKVLKISMPGGFGSYKCRAEVDMPSVTSATLSGAGNLTVKNAQAKDFELALDGSGNVTVSGDCKNVEVILSGSGNIDASELKCEAVSVLLQGSGNVTVAPKKEFHGVLTGSGNIACIGKPPSVQESVKGPGRIEYR